MTLLIALLLIYSANLHWSLYVIATALWITKNILVLKGASVGMGAMAYLTEGKKGEKLDA